MATYTAADLIKRALRLLGVLASGEEPEASEYTDGLMTFNQMIDSWSTESLSVYGTRDQQLTWPSGQATVLLGPSSPDFPGSICPVQLTDATYFILNGVSYPIKIINDDQYSNIPVKTVSTQIPTMLYPNMTLAGAFDCMEVTAYTVPSQDLLFHFLSVITLTEVTAETDVIYVPRGYYEAYVFNLAMKMAPEYGITPSREVRQGASKARANIKRINNPNVVMTTPLPSGYNGRYNIVTDGN